MQFNDETMGLSRKIVSLFAFESDADLSAIGWLEGSSSGSQMISRVTDRGECLFAGALLGEKV